MHVIISIICFFFFKQKTAYELVSGDWSSDVCSSDLTLALDKPETRNALSDDLLDDLLAALERSRADAGVRCVVLTSTHAKVFSAGGDLGQFAAPESLVHKHWGTDRFPRLFRAIGELGK